MYQSEIKKHSVIYPDLLGFQGHNGWVNDAAFSKDQKRVLSCSQDKTIRLWNIENLDDLPVVLEHKKNMGLKIIEVCPIAMCNFDLFLMHLNVVSNTVPCMFRWYLSRHILLIPCHTFFLPFDFLIQNMGMLYTRCSLPGLSSGCVVLTVYYVCLVQCQKCEKQFSITQVDNAGKKQLCVFCRLDTRTLP